MDWPILRRATLTAAIFAFTISLGEFGATILLSRPDYPTIPIAIYRFLSQPGVELWSGHGDGDPADGAYDSRYFADRETALARCRRILMLELDDIYKTYEDQSLLRGISFNVGARETICLLGASGSGKSTLLRMIAGLELPDSGQIMWDGQDLASRPAHLRDFGLVFQDYALFPHLDVFDNVAFGLKMRSLAHDEIRNTCTGSFKPC